MAIILRLDRMMADRKISLNELSEKVGIANVNMFRYRGYYYDFEIGMYYLWSRYFDPSIGRFINSDNPDIFVLYSVIENNLYTYCLNNPINNRDEKGRLAT